ncbi:MAG: tRNA (adenosine(37)-N6)-threonylcarbamoyltransferase complex dimerization subunit type 1 TsaB [Mycobacteriales bacterium]
MLLLVLDTSTPAVTTALVDVTGDGAPSLVAQQVTIDPRRHGEVLVPSVHEVLAQAGLTTGDVAAVVAGVGPGPYTGLRVGLVTALALADALAVPAYGACSLDGLAAPPPGGRLLVATDARRREVYWAAYDQQGTRTSGPAVDRPADIDVTGCDLARGAGAVMYADVLGLPVEPPEYPAALALAGLAADRALGGAPSEPLAPIYLRRPDTAPPGRPKAVLR